MVAIFGPGLKLFDIYNLLTFRPCCDLNVFSDMYFADLQTFLVSTSGCDEGPLVFHSRGDRGQ